MSTRATPRVGEVERRFLPSGRVEIRDSGGSRGIGGIGIPVGVVADIGAFTESVEASAVAGVLDMDVRGLFNHDSNYVLGRTKSGTMRLRAVKQGVEYVVPELPKARSDVLEAIERGDVDGSSWSFTIGAGGDEWTRKEDKKPHRRILRFERVFDVGPVAFPAYEGLATFSQRALDRAKGGTGPGLRRPMSTAEARRQMREMETKLRAIPDGPEKPPIVHRPDRRTAFHEAAHAFIVVVEGGRLHEIGPSSVRHAFPSDHERRGVLLHVSGYVAEKIAIGPVSARHLRASGDYAKAAARLRARGLDPSVWVPREMRYCEQLLRFYWPAVETLTGALMQRGRLPGAEAESIIWDSISTQAQRRLFVGDNAQWGKIVSPSMRA